jgi:type IV pilus biogenesis protein CpaD/CtpE
MPIRIMLVLIAVSLAACASSPPQQQTPNVIIRHEELPPRQTPRDQTRQKKQSEDLEIRLKHIQNELNRARALLLPEPPPDY